MSVRACATLRCSPPRKLTCKTTHNSPWASRCLAVRVLKGLEDVIQVHCVKPRWGVVNEETGNKSWVFGEKGEKFAGVPVDDPVRIEERRAEWAPQPY